MDSNVKGIKLILKCEFFEILENVCLQDAKKLEQPLTSLILQEK